MLKKQKTCLLFFILFLVLVVPTFASATAERHMLKEDEVRQIVTDYLRQKTEASSETRLVHTVRGVGYVLREE